MHKKPGGLKFVTISDVTDFYQRTDAFKARGGEGPCAGCHKILEPEEPFSTYDLAGKERTPRAFPQSIVLCKKCTFMLMGANMAVEPPPET
jgi:hypothetical protein